VLELTTAVAGPVAGCVLADMGAEVIKVEMPGARTAAQTAAPPPVEGAPDHPWNRIPLFNDLHRGKRLLAMNIARPEGHQLVLRLVQKCDVVLENFAPRVLGNLGLEYPQLRAVREDIILVSMPAFGKTGPYANRGSYGPGIDAMSGLSHLTGYPDRGPGKPAQFYCDYNAGLTAALATMAALRHRRRTGEGQRIELSMLEGELPLLAPALMDVAMNGRVASRDGNRHAWLAPQGAYRCAGEDQWLALSVEDDAQWLALASIIGCERLASLPVDARRERHDEIDALIAAWTRERSHYDAMHTLQNSGVPAGAVLNVAEVHRDPQLTHREAFAWQHHPEMGRFPHSRTAWRSRLGHHGVSGPGPTYGDGSGYAICELLGEPPERVAALAAEQIIAMRPPGVA
jgi:crotonobetainyl-CoA:carnitine CoA-transferase CaiB-like acyl-CoA transferase